MGVQETQLKKMGDAHKKRWLLFSDIAPGQQTRIEIEWVIILIDSKNSPSRNLKYANEFKIYKNRVSMLNDIIKANSVTKFDVIKQKTRTT